MLFSWVSAEKKWVDEHVTSLFPMPQLPMESQGCSESAYLQLNFLSLARPPPEPRAGCAPGSWSPDRAPTSPASVPPASGHSFVYIHTNSQADSFKHIARPRVLLAAASPHSSPPLSSIGCFQEQLKSISAEPRILAEPCSRSGVGVYLLLGEGTGMKSRKPSPVAPRTYPLPERAALEGVAGRP